MLIAAPVVAVIENDAGADAIVVIFHGTVVVAITNVAEVSVLFEEDEVILSATESPDFTEACDANVPLLTDINAEPPETVAVINPSNADNVDELDVYSVLRVASVTAVNVNEFGAECPVDAVDTALSAIVT